MATLKDDYWTPDNINLLVDKRIAKDAIFKQTNSDRLGWLQVAGDMKKDGGSKALNRINVRKQWFKICELYKKSLELTEESIRNELLDTPYYLKLRQFFEKSTTHSTSKYINQEFRKKMSARILNMSSYADRWTIDRTNKLIDSRIARHPMFKGRGHAANAWKIITQDLASDELDTSCISIQQVKKKWENLFTKYKAMHHTQIYDTKWPHFKKMHYFYTKIYEKEVPISKHPPLRIKDESDRMVYTDRWPASRTKFLIDRRIARSSMFGRGMSTGGWQAVLEDLIDYGAPSDLTISNVKKKWDNLLTRYKIIKDSETEHTTWPYYAQMEKYHNIKKLRKYKIETNETIYAEELLTAESIQVEEITESIISPMINPEKLKKCRLCQQIEGSYSLVEDKELCDKIIQCTSINVNENLDILPSAICGICKTTIENFYEFMSLCCEVDKELKISLEKIVIKTEDSSEEHRATRDSHDEIEILTQETLECPECPAFFTSSETLETHIKSHKVSVKYHCEICSIGFTKQSALFSHFNKHHFEVSKVENLEMQNVEIEYIVERNEIENSDLESADNIDSCDINTEEIAQIIVPNEYFQCELCSKTFSNQKSLREHFNTHSRTEHYCLRENCNKKFTTLNSLRQHEMRHLGINSYLCTICGKGFVAKNALKMHEKIHSEVKEHICEFCSRGFSVFSNLRAHQKKHHEGHRFYCSQCPKQFLTKSSLQRHELVHTGVKEFVCDTCSSAFFTLKELKKHKRYHEGVKQYHCSECFKTFYEKHHLTIHMRCHTGERPFACTMPGCNKSFREKQKLQRHLKTPHRLTQPE